jgi:hypothetical protein
MDDGTCLLTDCAKPRRTKVPNLCPMHWERQRRTGSLDLLPLKPRGKASPDFVPKYGQTCSVAQCGKRAHLRGWCYTHYTRWRATGPVLSRNADQRLASSAPWSNVIASSRAWLVPAPLSPVVQVRRCADWDCRRPLWVQG